MCNHLLKLQRFLEHPRAQGAIGISLKVCLQLKPRFGLTCEVWLFGEKFCVLSGSKRTWKPTTPLMPGEFTYLHLPPKKITPNSLNIWKNSKCLKTSYAYNKVDWQQKNEFPHFPLARSSPSLHFQHLLSISTVRHAHLQWYQTGSSGAPKHGKNTAAVEFRWNKLRHSSHPSVCASVGDFDVEKIRFLFVLTIITWNYG